MQCQNERKSISMEDRHSILNCFEINHNSALYSYLDLVEFSVLCFLHL